MGTSEVRIRFKYPNRLAPSVYKALSSKGGTRHHWRVRSVQRWETWHFSYEAWASARNLVKGFFSSADSIEIAVVRYGRTYWEPYSDGPTE